MNAPYEVVISARADRDLQRLPAKAAAACAEFVFSPLSDNPHRLGKPLRNELARFHAARRGSYRVVYKIDDDRHVIEIEHVDHRSDVYR